MAMTPRVTGIRFLALLNAHEPYPRFLFLHAEQDRNRYGKLSLKHLCELCDN